MKDVFSESLLQAFRYQNFSSERTSAARGFSIVLKDIKGQREWAKFGMDFYLVFWRDVYFEKVFVFVDTAFKFMFVLISASFEIVWTKQTYYM